MKPWVIWLLVVLSIAAAAGGGYWLGHRSSAATTGDKDDEKAPAGNAEEKPVAAVVVVPLRHKEISEQVMAYGTVVAPPGEVRVVSVPFESRVTKLFVTPGQTVAASQPLVEVEGSAATALAFEEARNAAAAAERDLQLVKQRYEQKLATNADLFMAENALRSAQARLLNLQQAGAGGPRKLTAEAAGIISKVDVQIGQVLASGSPLVEVVAQNRIEVKLGAEPADIPYLKPGQPVRLVPSDFSASDPVLGKIRLIGQRVDPAARLTDVNVTLPPDTKLLLDGFVSGEMTKTSAAGLVVSREAILPGDEGVYTLFTVKDGVAVKHTVKVGVENDAEVQVIADDLKEGDLAVILGNYELEDGMKVRVQSVATEPAATEPVSKEAPDTAPAATEPSTTEPAKTEPATTQPGASTKPLETGETR